MIDLIQAFSALPIVGIIAYFYQDQMKTTRKRFEELKKSTHSRLAQVEEEISDQNKRLTSFIDRTLTTQSETKDSVTEIREKLKTISARYSEAKTQGSDPFILEELQTIQTKLFRHEGLILKSYQVMRYLRDRINTHERHTHDH